MCQDNNVAVAEKTESRVGKRLEYLDDARVGETLHFYYGAGSEDGYRTVRVLKVEDGHIEGPTLERDGAYRRYNDDHATSIQIVERFPLPDDPTPTSGGELRVRFDDAGAKLLASLSGEKLAELYNQFVAVEGEGAAFDANTGEVVVKLPEPPKPEFSETDDKMAKFTVKAGKNTLRVWIHGDSIGTDFNMVGEHPTSETDISPETLYEQLGKILGK